MGVIEQLNDMSHAEIKTIATIHNDYHDFYGLGFTPIKLNGSRAKMAEDLSHQLKKITPEDAMADYEKLCKLECGKINVKSLIGNKAMDFFFFKHRLATKAKGGKSFLDFVTEDKKSKSADRLYEYGIANKKNPMVAIYDVFRLYNGSINAFKPIIVRDLYCMYKPKAVLDFSAGWGGRCLGAMSLNIDYIGFDTNTSLRKAYADMIKTYPHDCKVKIIFKDSSTVDYSKYKYDFVFTSPPYYQKKRPTEKYEHMPDYENREDFNTRFLFPVLRETYKGLSIGGHYALNVPMDMYEDIKTVLGEANKKLPLFIQKRRAGKEGGYKEFIYVWNKGGGANIYKKKGKPQIT